MIQQFREAPSAYIKFVNELIDKFIKIREAALQLEKIFNKLKNYFWGEDETGEQATTPDANKNHNKMNVNIETEHMALFYHDIMKDQAIYKIMKSAQQSIEDDKATINEYKIFREVVNCYKRIYAYCKQCYKVALIRQKFEEPAKSIDTSQGKSCCENPNCHFRRKKEVQMIQNQQQQQQQQTPPQVQNANNEEVQAVEENKCIKKQQNTTPDYISDEEIEEEDEESSDGDIEFQGQAGTDIDDLLSEYRKMMEKKLEEEENNEKMNKQINELSIDDVVSLIEQKQDKQPQKSKKGKKKKNNKKKTDGKPEEAINTESKK